MRKPFDSPGPDPWLHRLPSPVGPLLAAVDPEGRLVYLGFGNHEFRDRVLVRLAEPLGRDPALLEPLRHQLDEYFAGRRRTFDLSLDLRGTPFQRRVWAELQRIPWGRTISYGELARRLGNPNLTRAVGTANGANPVSIVVPCHRVIGADGSLTGYGGGLDIKAKLLALEGAWSPRLPFGEEVP
jgi:methylated-DNA-[protein]-cysteine S-methyltransferase